MTSSKDNSHCPICERFIGNELTCPYCDIKTRNFKSRIFMIILATSSAIVGLVYLALFSFYQRDNFIKIEDVTKMMNYATISIEGSIKETPYKVKDSLKEGYIEYFSFTIEDNGAEIRIAYSPKPKISIFDNIPAKGDRIRIIDGRVGIGKNDGKPRVYIKNIKQLETIDWANI